MKLRGKALVTGWSVFALFGIACGGDPTAPLPPPLTGAVSVSVGTRHACAVIDDGTVRCWGFAAFGELGDGREAAFSPRPVTVMGLGDVSAIEAGDGYNCALGSASGVSCWGVNISGETGNGGWTVEERAPVTVKGLSGPVNALSMGEGHTPCARLVDGTVECWGRDAWGLNPDPQGLNLAPTAIPGLSSVRAVAANGLCACALLEEGTVKCWGAGPIGQPAGAPSVSEVPVTVPGLTDAVEIAVGESHACARRVDGNVMCWGWMLGTDGWSSPTPVNVDALAGAIAIASGKYSTCVVRTDGTVRCMGTLDDPPRHGPVPGVDDAVSISVGPSSACAAIADGTIRCWGDGNYGQLGDGRDGFLTGEPPAQSGVRVVAPTEMED